MSVINIRVKTDIDNSVINIRDKTDIDIMELETEIIVDEFSALVEWLQTFNLQTEVSIQKYSHTCLELSESVRIRQNKSDGHCFA